MSHTEDRNNQIEEWLKKLQQESWQLELLVSGFTIFLLFTGNIAFEEYFDDLPYRYNVNDSFLTFIYLFIGLLGWAIKALILFLILHLMLRGFWIGAIGLRSVQNQVNFEDLRYSEIFTKRLKSKVTNLDNLVTRLDEICSVIFAFSFLVISMFLSFGLYLLFYGIMAVILLYATRIAPGPLETFANIIAGFGLLTFLITGIMYLVDYFTLGFLKKFNWLSKIYMPFYRFYGIITISGISRSIYYYLISKFSKKRIRSFYLVAMVIFLASWFFRYDQYIYYPSQESLFSFENNYYDNLRPENHHVNTVSIRNHIISNGFIELFIRYDPQDNPLIAAKCPKFEPIKNEGFNPRFKMKIQSNGLNIQNQNFSDEDQKELLNCLSSIYSVSIDDFVLTGLTFFFHDHNQHGQAGLYTMIPVDSLENGLHQLAIGQDDFSGEEIISNGKKSHVPFWVTQ